MFKVNATKGYLELIVFTAQQAGIDIFYCDTLELHGTEWGPHYVPNGYMPCFSSWGSVSYCKY